MLEFVDPTTKVPQIIILTDSKEHLDEIEYEVREVCEQLDFKIYVHKGKAKVKKDFADQ